MKDALELSVNERSDGERTLLASLRSLLATPRLVVMLMGLVLLLAAALAGRNLLYAGIEETEDASIVAEIVPLGARAGGQVTRVLVRDDQGVEPGDTLVELDGRVLALEEAQAETELAISRTQLRAATAEVEVVEAQASGGLRSARASLAASREQSLKMDFLGAAAEAEVKRAEKEAQRASSELARVQKLFASGMVSGSEVEDAQMAEEIARSALVRTQAQTLAARHEKLLSESWIVEAQGRLEQLAARDARLQMAHIAVETAAARVAAAEQALEMVRLRRSFLKVTAPRAGVVSRLMVREGQMVEAGQLLLHLVANPMTVVANFKETQIRRIRPGQRATIHVDAYPERPLEGEVLSLSGGTQASFSLLPANNASGNFVKVVQRVPVRIALSEPWMTTAQSGLSVNVVVHVE